MSTRKIIWKIHNNSTTDGLEEQFNEMVALMNQHEIPEPNACCKNCAYSEQYAKVIHQVGGNGTQRQGSLF